MPRRDARALGRRLRRFAERDVPRETMTLVGRVLRSFALPTIQRTPLNDPARTPPGLAKGNWRTSVGARGSLPIARIDPSGAAPIAEMRSVAREIALVRNRALWFQPVFFWNALHYIHWLEFGLYPIPGGPRTIAGFSTQAPAGMLRIAVAATVQRFRGQVRGRRYR